jgi:hypothetical protein
MNRLFLLFYVVSIDLIKVPDPTISERGAQFKFYLVKSQKSVIWKLYNKVCTSTDFACWWVSCFFHCGVVMILWIFFLLYKDNCRVLNVWAKKRKENNQRTAGFFRYLFEISESKNQSGFCCSFQYPPNTGFFMDLVSRPKNFLKFQYVGC